MNIHSQELTLKNIFTARFIIFAILGIDCAVLALKGFMIPNGFLDGGVTGIAILCHELFHVSFSAVALIVNLLFVYPAYKYISKIFAIRFCLSVIGLSMGVEFVHIEAVTTDKLLIALFGGGLIGIGMGLVTRAGAAFDGFEVLAALTSKKVAFSITEIILFLNSIIFLVAAMKFGIESAMYSLITYFAATKMADYVVDGIEEYIALTIISKDADLIKSLITNDLKKAITIYKGKRGYLPNQEETTHDDVDIIVTIVTRFEILDIQDEIRKIDPTAFMYMSSIKETMGGVVKQKAGH